MFLQAPAVKIPVSLQVPEALVTWKTICTLGTERNLMLYILQKLPHRFDTDAFKAVEDITNAGGRLDVQKG